MQKRDVHPEVVARAFKVHLRTVFRWVEKDFLHSWDGLIYRAEVLEALSVWRQTYSTAEARKLLQIDVRTLNVWANGKGVLKEVELFGKRRVYKVGVRRILRLPHYRPGTTRVLFNADSPEAIALRKEREAELEAQHERGRVIHARAAHRRAKEKREKLQREARRKFEKRQKNHLREQEKKITPEQQARWREVLKKKPHF